MIVLREVNKMLTDWLIEALPTRCNTYSSEAGVDADFKPVEVDIAWRQTDRQDRVSEGNRTGQLQQGNVTYHLSAVVCRVTNHSGHAVVDDIWVRIRFENSSQSYSQLWRR